MPGSCTISLGIAAPEGIGDVEQQPKPPQPLFLLGCELPGRAVALELPC